MTSSARITMNLSPKAVTALEEVARTSGLTKTDCVNRALQMYAYLEAEMANGSRLVLVRPGGMESEVKFL